MDKFMLHEEYHKSTVGEFEKYLLMLSGRRPKLRWAPSSILGHLQTWRTHYHYRDDGEYTITREQGIQTCR